jgi:hypothetical protein
MVDDNLYLTLRKVFANTIFGSSQYMPVLIFGLIAVIALFEIWWLNFRYFPSL